MTKLKQLIWISWELLLAGTEMNEALLHLPDKGIDGEVL